MLYQNICFIGLSAHISLTRTIYGATYYADTTDATACSSANIDDHCVFLCDRQDWKNDFDCGNAGVCDITCEKKQCFMDSIITATNSLQLNIISQEEKCYKSAVFQLPNSGSANFSVSSINSNDPFQEMTVNAGTNTQNIWIDCAADSKDECKKMTINAQTAQFLLINVNGASLSEEVVINCPQNVTRFNADTYEAPCYIDARNTAILTDVLINTLYGIPFDAYIHADDGGEQLWDAVTLTCLGIDENAACDENDIFDATQNSCWNTRAPTIAPTIAPSLSPTQIPTTSTDQPSISPTNKPTLSPTNTPTVRPTDTPTKTPTDKPTLSPTKFPTKLPTKSPTKSPTKLPTKSPTNIPTNATLNPSVSPSIITVEPTFLPTLEPTTDTFEPSKTPSNNPSDQTDEPTEAPSLSPTNSTTHPTKFKNEIEAMLPTKEPTYKPTKAPTRNITASDSYDYGSTDIVDSRVLMEWLVAILMAIGMIFCTCGCYIFLKPNITRNRKKKAFAVHHVPAYSREEPGSNVLHAARINESMSDINEIELNAAVVRSDSDCNIDDDDDDVLSYMERVHGIGSLNTLHIQGEKETRYFRKKKSSTLHGEKTSIVSEREIPYSSPFNYENVQLNASSCINIPMMTPLSVSQMIQPSIESLNMLIKEDEEIIHDDDETDDIETDDVKETDGTRGVDDDVASDALYVLKTIGQINEDEAMEDVMDLLCTMGQQHDDALLNSLSTTQQ